MKADKYIESKSISQICDDILSLLENKEISYLLVHTHGHYSDNEDPIIQFSYCSENLRGRARTLRTIYRYKKEYIGEVIKKLLEAKELSETLHIKPLFDNDLVIHSIHNNGVLFISTDLIDHIVSRDDDDIYATIYFKNYANIDIEVFEKSFLEKVLEESGRYDLLI